MAIDRERLRRALNLAVRHSYAEIALLSARACDPTVARDKRPDAVLWSWINISGSWTGTMAIVQPLDLALHVVKQAKEGLVEPVPTEILLETQGEITTHVANKLIDQLFIGTTKPILSEVRLGNGAPDVRRGDWQGNTWSVGDWWMAIFVFEGSLSSIPTPTAPIAAELIPDTERVTSSIPLTKVLRNRDEELEVEWSGYDSSPLIPAAMPKQQPPSAKPIAPITPPPAKPLPEITPLPVKPVVEITPLPVPAKPQNIPVPPKQPVAQIPPKRTVTPVAPTNQDQSDSGSSSRRPVVRTIHGLLTPEDAQSGAHRILPIPKSPSAQDTNDADRTQPWFKPKVEKVVDFQIPRELGHYRVLNQLGEGGMGVVLKGEHMNLDRRVAIKLMKPSLAGNKLFAERFMREARIAASLEHPNLVNIYDAAQENGFLYMALRFMGGGDLTGQLKREGPLSEPRAIHMFTALLSALHYINTKKLVHLDIKPGNVLLDTDYSPRLGDLGLARQRSAAKSETDIMGTPAYMSPEQLRGVHEIDIRSDIYSMGLTMYVAMTCKQPLQGDDLESTIRNVLEVDPPDPRSIMPSLSLAMSQVIMKAIKKRPQDRYQTPHEFQDALSNVELESLNELSASGVSWFGKMFGGRK